ncbi:hypothetical protein FCM35_KLT08567 [Carex littledalei]|uniref:Spatacsin C-terminal domain-containing protein n=1 Tax=Carex littledalei TaxID=544730 RepID=A0A833V700_9POAL|nr:hypothetical protein FCM35_KLT08567 [Carex littledalei]
MERAVLSLLELGQITAAKQLQQKLSPTLDLPIEQNRVDPSQLQVVGSCQLCLLVKIFYVSLLCFKALDALSRKCGEGRGRGLCLRVIAVVRAAMVLGLTFAEAFGKQPLELLQLLSLKAQGSIEEATLLVETYSPPLPSIALILAESFLNCQLCKGKWLVEILILAHHFYMSSACLDGVDVLVTFVANRVESYVLEDDFSSLARLVTGVANFRSFSFILDILIESGQLELLLEKYSAAAETATGSVAAVRGFRMTVLTSLKRYNPHDLDAFAMVYNHFDMKHDAANHLESRSTNRIQHWLSLKDRDRRERSGELLDSMFHLIEAGETLSTIDAGQRTHRACARASLLTLQIRIPDITWVQLSETNVRRILVEQSRFQEALVVAEAYGLNQGPSLLDPDAEA